MRDTSKKLCFIVGPIGSPGEPVNDHANFLLEYIIKPVMADFPEYRVVRQDENTTPGMIDTQIIVALRDADLVIADLSHLNPNALYEIGIRHMVSKPIIHMQLQDQRIPFDLSLYKTVKFSLVNPATIAAARALLKAQVTEAIAEGHEPDNPVTRALGQQQLKQTASPELKVIADSLQSLAARVAALEGTELNELDENHYVFDYNKDYINLESAVVRLRRIASWNGFSEPMPGKILASTFDTLTDNQIQTARAALGSS
jgi:hypothetical protein